MAGSVSIGPCQYLHVVSGGILEIEAASVVVDAVLLLVPGVRPIGEATLHDPIEAEPVKQSETLSCDSFCAVAGQDSSSSNGERPSPPPSRNSKRRRSVRSSSTPKFLLPT